MMKPEEIINKRNKRNFKLIIHNENKEFGRIFQIISHDLRTPLAVFRSNLQLIRGFQFDIDENLKRDKLQDCEQSVASVLQFVENIHFLNSCFHSSIVPHNSHFKIKQIVHKLLSKGESNNLNRRCHISWDLSRSYFYSDLNFIREICQHLISNALKFSTGEVDFTISSSGNHLSIVVKDRGAGIPKNETELIFDPFYRASNTRGIAGPGLGLAIVEALTKSLGGMIFLSSRVGKGTSIEIIIPDRTSELRYSYPEP